jgi:hypothetical protein
MSLCEELKLICRECGKRHVAVVENGGEVVVYADLMKELFNTAVRRTVESHVAKCAREIAAAMNMKAEPRGWREVNGKMRFFFVVH